MSYERKDIPELIGAFETAKKVLLAETTSHYLCHALGAAQAHGHASSVICIAKRLVGDAIGGHISLRGFYRYAAPYPTTAKGERQIRMDWCDKIIRDLRAYQP